MAETKTKPTGASVDALANVDLKVLETLVARSVAETKRRYPQATEDDA